MSEKDIQRLILDYLAYRPVFFWRNNTGGFYKEYKGRNQFIRFGTPGSPDIIVVKEGQIYGIEVKTAKGKQNANQIAFERDFVAHGGIYILARSLEDVNKIL